MADFTYVDARGRVVLPAGLRSRLSLEEGTRLVIEVEGDGSVRLTPAHVAARALIGIAGHRPGAVEGFLAERREEAAREDAESGLGPTR